MCCAAIIAKYVLFIVNLVFSLLGLAIVGFGIAMLVVIKNLDQIIAIKIIPISMIVLGIIVFFIAFLACCGAIRESQCMLVSYTITIFVLAALKIWLAVVIYSGLSNIQGRVDDWLVTAFDNYNVRPAFHLLEHLFRCCGTTGPNSYEVNSETLPPTCCPNPDWNPDWVNPDWNPEQVPSVNVTICTVESSYSGCGVMVGNWFESFGGIMAATLLVVIFAEILGAIIALFFCITIRNKRRKNY